MLDYLGMVCLAANQVWWTAEVENVFVKITLVCSTVIYLQFKECAFVFIFHLYSIFISVKNRVIYSKVVISLLHHIYPSFFVSLGVNFR